MVHNGRGRRLTFHGDGGALGFQERLGLPGLKHMLDLVELGLGLFDELRHLLVLLLELAEIMVNGLDGLLFTRTTEAGILPVL